MLRRAQLYTTAEVKPWIAGACMDTIQEPVIQWLSFVYVLHICFSLIFLYK